jgi:hypothetical protein
MTISYDITHSDSLIQVRVNGSLDVADVRRLWTAIVEACETHNCYDILGVSALDQPFSTVTAFNHHEIFTDVGVTLRHRIAWVDENGASNEILAFTESVLVNRSKLNGALFPSVEAARKWLNEDGPAE